MVLRVAEEPDQPTTGGELNQLFQLNLQSVESLSDNEGMSSRTSVTNSLVR